MKALVVARLLLGDLDNWKVFVQEREVAGQISNRRMARSVSAQIGRNYRDLSSETEKFINENFARCDYSLLAHLCDAIEPNIGLYLRLDEFESRVFPLADSVKLQFPRYAHVSISIYGLQFEFPEHHFIKDLGAAFEDLREVQERLDSLGLSDQDVKRRRNDVDKLLSRQKFISRSMISASFSLVEAFLSGLFYLALNFRRLGGIQCDEDFLRYAEKKESAALKDRLNRVVQFASLNKMDARSEPFKSFVEIGKRYRDAIHHTTPFERKNLAAGERLLNLYEIEPELALLCTCLSLATILRISMWLFGDEDKGDITRRCNELYKQITAYAREHDLLRDMREAGVHPTIVSPLPTTGG
jgi:hypothetical protein